jgi:ATP/ADP translocase
MTTSFVYSKSELWRNLGIVFLYWIAFVALQILAMEKFQRVYRSFNYESTH